jgi:hypothetical protein
VTLLQVLASDATSDTVPADVTITTPAVWVSSPSFFHPGDNDDEEEEEDDNDEQEVNISSQG